MINCYSLRAKVNSIISFSKKIAYLCHTTCFIMTETKATRCYYLDFAKVITTVLVIFGHLYSVNSPVRLYLYGFHMPFFFLVSGVFHKYTGMINWSHYSRTILWPILIFIVLSILTNVLFYSAPLTDQLRSFFIDIPKGKVDGIIWFLFALFWCRVFMDLCCEIRNKLIPFFIWGCLLFVPVFIMKNRLPFALSQGMMAFPFYAFGYYGKDFLIKRKETLYWGIPFICCLILTVLITKYLHGRVSMLGVRFGNLAGTVFGNSVENFSLVSRAFLRIANIFLFYLNGLIGSAMILSFSLLPFPKTEIITSLSKSLITVVGTQYIFINVITRTLGLNNGYVLSIGLSLCVFILCYFAHKLLQPVYSLATPKSLHTRQK